jgi:hypothetical protein
MTIVENAGGNGNGRLDPGETGMLRIQSSNVGHSIALNTTASLTGSNSFFQISNPVYTIGSLAAGETIEAEYSFSVSSEAPIGSAINLENILTSGQYADTTVFTQVIGMIDEDFETGDFSKYEWVQGGSRPWTVSSAAPFEGIYCSRSGAIVDDQTSELSVNFDVVSADSISFYRKVSSELTYDFLRFYVDNNMEAEWSGDLGWQRFSCLVNPGNHTFRWSYEKDVTQSSGSDAAWVDYIIFPPVAPITSTGPEATSYSFGIYPNPTSGKLIVNYHLTAEMKVTFTLCDAAGRQLLILAPAATHPAGDFTVNASLSTLKPGMYFLRMDAGNSSLTRKILIK